MKETVFISQNSSRWEEVEQQIDCGLVLNPIEAAEAYTALAADLSYSRSHYPSSRVTEYLNGLAASYHNMLYKSRFERYSRIWRYWSREIPEVMSRSQRELLYSFIVFTVSVLTGVVSNLGDDSFTRLILGDGYVDMTLRNIERGEPMAVYSDSSSLPMFVRIAYNNLRVAFLLFVSGMFTGFGTGFALFVNGVMVGSFQTFMFQQGVGFESMLAIWLHGTFEITAFVTVGAGGFALGNGWLFPGTYSRGYAFRQGAKRGLKIVMSLVPIIIVAAFIESYFTRHTEYPNALRLAVILLSLGLMVWYYVVLPQRIKTRTQ